MQHISSLELALLCIIMLHYRHICLIILCTCLFSRSKVDKSLQIYHTKSIDTFIQPFIHPLTHRHLCAGDEVVYPKDQILSYKIFFYLTCTLPPFQLIQKLRNSSQERMPGVAALTRGSPILPTEIQERVFCLPPSTISSISTLSWGLAERAKWASLWVLTATWNWFILAGFFTYWYSYLLGVEMWILSENGNNNYFHTF